MTSHIRAFEDRDYARLAEIESAIDAQTAASADILRERDSVDEPRVRLLQLAADNASGEMVGAGRVMNLWWNFNPGYYQLRIAVDPVWQHQGLGAGLFDRLLEHLRSWNAEVIRSEARSGSTAASAFLEHRGFREWRRQWEMVLDLSDADTSSLEIEPDAHVMITTFAEASRSRGDQLAHDVWQLEDAIFRSVPSALSEGEGMSFERFLAVEINASWALPRGHFLAYAGDRLVGVSRLARDRDRPGRLEQSLTGTHPDFRGLGIAQALKLRTIQFAREQGYREIWTHNDSTNEPMLHINQLIGFRQRATIVIYELRL